MDIRGRTLFFRIVFLLTIVVTVYFTLQILPLLSGVFSILKVLLIPLVIASILAYLLHPLVVQIESFGISRTTSVVLIFIAITTIVAFLLTIGIPALMKQIQLAIKSVPSQLKELEVLTNRFQAQMNTLPSPIRTHTKEWLEQFEKYSGTIVAQVENIALFLVRSTIAIIIVPFLVFYILKDIELIKKSAWYVTPRQWRKPLVNYMKDIDKTIGRFIRGQLLVAVAVSMIAMIGLALLGVPYPIALGLFIGIADLIPFFGAFLGAIPAILIALLESWKLAVATTIFIFVLQQLEGNFLAPYIVGKTLALHPILIIIALLVGVEVGGVAGLLFAVPILAISKVTLQHLFYH